MDPQIYSKLDLSAIVENPYLHENICLCRRMSMILVFRRPLMMKVFLKEFKSALAGKKKERLRLMRNTDRTLGTIFPVRDYQRSMAIHCRKDQYTVKCNGGGG